MEDGFVSRPSRVTNPASVLRSPLNSLKPHDLIALELRGDFAQ